MKVFLIFLINPLPDLVWNQWFWYYQSWSRTNIWSWWSISGTLIIFFIFHYSWVPGTGKESIYSTSTLMYSRSYQTSFDIIFGFNIALCAVWLPVKILICICCWTSSCCTFTLQIAYSLTWNTHVYWPGGEHVQYSSPIKLMSQVNSIIWSVNMLDAHSPTYRELSCFKWAYWPFNFFYVYHFLCRRWILSGQLEMF